MELKARCKERFEPVVQAIRQLQKEKEGLDEPLIVAIDGRCGSGKTTLGEYLEQVLRPIFQKQTVFYQPFSCRKWNLLEGYPVPYKKLNIIEGSYSMHPYFKNPYQLRVFLNISPKDQMENIKKRNGPEKAKQFQNMWIPKEEAYFKKFHVMDGAIQVMWNLKTEK